MQDRPRVGDQVILEARVAEVNAKTFTVYINEIGPIEIPFDHPRIVSLWRREDQIEATNGWPGT